MKCYPAAHAAGLVDAVDVFIESIAFSVEQGERVFAVAQQLGLPVKAHVEQLSDLGGAVMAAQHGALSVDHIEYLQAKDVGIWRTIIVSRYCCPARSMCYASSSCRRWPRCASTMWLSHWRAIPIPAVHRCTRCY